MSVSKTLFEYVKKILGQFKLAKLVAKCFFAETTPKEQEQVDKWFEEHNHIANQLQDWDNYTNRRDSISRFDSKMEWHNFSHKAKQHPIYKRRWIRPALSYAASLIAIITLGSLGYMYVTYKIDTTTPIYVEAEPISSGEQKARLVLSSGKVLNLNEKTNTGITEKDGTEIKNDSTMLSYHDTPKKLNTKKRKKNTAPLFNLLEVGRGMEYFLILSDGTKVWMNSESSLKYPVQFTQKNRIVELTGEAYFEVAKNANHPFIVKTTDYDVRVLGTSFNISNYADNKQVITTLLEGSVSVEHVKGIEGKYSLEPDQQLIFDKHRLKATVQNVDARRYCSWIDGYFWIDGEPLEDAVRKMTRWYDMQVFFMDEQSKKEPIVGKLPRFKDFNVIVSMLEDISNVDITIKNKTVTVKTKQ